GKKKNQHSHFLSILCTAPLSKPTILTSNNTAVETKDFSLTCNATGQIHAYKWFINGVAPAGLRIQLSPDRRTLTLRSLTRRVNKGPYVCEIENPFYRNRSDPFTLDVAYGPDIATIVHSADEYPPGANITLSCVADSNPAAQFTWLHNGQPVSNSATFSIIASLSDAGTYTCTASNSFTGLTRTTTKNIIIYGEYLDWAPNSVWGSLFPGMTEIDKSDSLPRPPWSHGTVHCGRKSPELRI
uniref:Ig-like domain-containing protein n=1 Tax=Monodelphis domestica TaxID=13616 RepID=H9H6K8_MONDO